MLSKAFKYYIDSYRGFKREVWILTLASLVNRAGTMVIPFLSLYLTSDIGMSMTQVGWVMTAFGTGSFLGSWLGGKLADTIGPYQTMVGSLLLSGILFFLLQFVYSFEGFCLAIIILMTVADTFRPALFVSIKQYSKPENRTRSVSLVRLAINLGFSLGPALGGLIISKLGYAGLFWVDGLTCVVAGLVLILFFNRNRISDGVSETSETPIVSQSPYRDKAYMLFLLTVVLVSIAFLQYFSAIPLFYRDVHGLDEQQIGLLLAANGFIIFLLEMPFIKRLEQTGWSHYRVLIVSTILLSFSFLVMNMSSWSGVLIIGMLAMTFGEMMNFPYANRFAMDRADGRKTGAYMAAYTIAFSLGHIIGHNAGLQIVTYFGYALTWYIMAALLLIAAVIVVYLKRMIEPAK